ncbi:chromate transporter [Anaerocolumna cellulosilytica]|uniref:Chromate transporter n=1 Tax=Anaerocolumna cellulosilytica TaxID=433286 RepID=A0A6S6QVL2_9FIRM|nr:chromate transporter [Anaerocolumna cellulosilytica]MBB5195986.1 chromate transporter [Anaerocolumna cellulosilytica]BCJ93716.1 chromate transporter [Anaerocolumna cellulosilytica]
MKHTSKFYLQLFSSTFYISAFTFGGGFVIIPLLKKKFADDLKWIKEKDIIHITAIAQSTPGSVAVNASVLIGYQCGGLVGALLAILGTVLPPFLILSLVSLFYNTFQNNIAINLLLRGMQAGIAAVLVDVVFTMGREICKKKEAFSILMMLISFLAAYFFGINIALLILACGVIGAIQTMYRMRKGKET